MANNTTVPGGDVIRDLDRLTAGVKTQVMQLDVGGASTNAESLVSTANPLPVVQTGTPALPTGAATQATLAAVLAALGASLISVQETDVLSNAGTAVTPLFAPVSASLSGANTLVNSTAGKKIRVLQYVMIASGAVNAEFQTSTGSALLSGLMDLSSNGGAAAPYCPVGLLQTLAGDSLILNLSGAVAVGGHLVYVLI